jgi:hypothetical protein
MNGFSGLVISIRKYLQADRQAEEALEQLCRLLLEGMDQSAPEDASEERARLKESTRSALAAINEGVSPAELLERGSRATEALKNYHGQVVERAQRPLAELRAKVKLLTGGHYVRLRFQRREHSPPAGDPGQGSHGNGRETASLAQGRTKRMSGQYPG